MTQSKFNYNTFTLPSAEKCSLMTAGDLDDVSKQVAFILNVLFQFHTIKQIMLKMNHLLVFFDCSEDFAEEMISVSVLVPCWKNSVVW